MTDNEIIKALEGCSCDTLELALDLINRQKAEIERLKDLNVVLETDNINANMNLEHITYEFDLLNQEKATVESKAIKEFAERLCKEFSQCQREYRNVLNSDGACAMIIAKNVVNNLVKEMTSEKCVKNTPNCTEKCGESNDERI